ncbi:unnamed protein product [Closterium sp. Naga37s-1]|nr:unnamed protein product [Closterium sp. Naga37s-1]
MVVFPLALLLLVTSWPASTFADFTDDATLEKELSLAGLTGFLSLLKQGGLLSELELRARNGSAVTLFAPTNEALMRTNPAFLAFLKLQRNDAMLHDVLMYHVIEKPVSAFAWEGSFSTLQGAPIQLHVDALAFQVGDSTVKQYKAVTMSMGLADGQSVEVFAGTIVVHSINSLLVPPALDEAFLETDLNTILAEGNESDGDQGLYGSDIRRSMLAGAPGSEPLPGPPVTSSPPPPPSPTVPVQPLPTPPPAPTTAPPPPKSAPDTLDALNAFDALVLFVSNAAFWVQLQGTGLLLLLAVLWFKASQLRLNEARRIIRERRTIAIRDVANVAALDVASGSSDPGNLSQDARHAQQQQQQQQQQEQHELPKVTVVLAVKGCAGDAGMSNWRSHVQTLYGGASEFIFCVETAHDPACRAVKALQREMCGLAQIRLVVAGLATRCSQQIHNQLAVAMRAGADSKYLLFLDDDIQTHPDTLTLLVTAMEENPNALVCTGYSFDFPGPDPQTRRNLAAYAAMVYRVPVQLAMASGGKQLPVWGGCMMIRLDDLRADRYGMLTALSARGYSNDLTLSAIAASNGRDVVCPAAAIFPGILSGSWTFQRYWNYVRRQTFALTTFCSPVALALNACALLLYGYGSFCLLAPLLPSALRVARFLSSVARGEPAWNLPSTGPDWDPYPSSPSSLISSFILSSLSGVSSFNSSAAIALILVNASLFLALLYLSLLALATLAVIRLFHTTFSLCNLLSPEKPPIRLGSLSLMLGVAGMLVNLAVVPIVSVYTLLQPAITWAGITYVRRWGLIVEVRHPQHPQVGQQQQQQQQHRQLRDGGVTGEREEMEGTMEVEMKEEDGEEEQQWLLPPLASSPVSGLKQAG